MPVSATFVLWSMMALPSKATTISDNNNNNNNNNNILSVPLVPHHVQKARRSLSPDPNLRRRTKGGAHPLTVAGLYQGYGTHYIDLWVGSPPQRTTVIVDTGSGVTAFPCAGCNNCGESHHTDKYFDPEKSSSFVKSTCDNCKRGRCTNNICQIGMSYQEGSSWTAYEATDKSYVGGLHAAPLLEDGGADSDLDPLHAKHYAFDLFFGCQTHLTGLFKTQLADGIMGMDNVASSYWSQAKKQGILDKSNFSLCFSRQPTATREGTEAGALTLGGVDPRMANENSPMVWSTFSKSGGGFYAVHLRKFYLREGGAGDSALTAGGVKVVPLNYDEKTLNAGNVIVDSGTTDSYFSRRIGPEFKKVWKEMTGKDYNHNAVALTEEQLNQLPTIILQMEGDNINKKFDAGTVGMAGQLDPAHPHDILLAVPPSHYMEFDEKSNNYVARFYVDEGGGSVIGANAMMGHDVNFDVDNKRIGWAESTCDYTSLVNSNGYHFDPSAGVSVEVDKQEEVKPVEVKPVEEPPVPVPEPKEEKQEKEETPEKPVTEEKKKPVKDDKTTDSALKKPDGSVPSTVDSCSSITCRGGFVAGIVGFLLVALLGWRRMSSKSRVEYQAAELEFPNLDHDDDGEDDFGRYRDDPKGEESYEYDDDEEEEEDDVADEGVGYEDEPVKGNVV